MLWWSLADPGGAPRRPPQQDQFLSFSHMFLLKSVRIGGWPPPPQREILDPPLVMIPRSIQNTVFSFFLQYSRTMAHGPIHTKRPAKRYTRELYVSLFWFTLWPTMLFTTNQKHQTASIASFAIRFYAQSMVTDSGQDTAYSILLLHGVNRPQDPQFPRNIIFFFCVFFKLNFYQLLISTFVGALNLR